MSDRYYRQLIRERNEQVRGCMVQARMGKRNGETGPHERMQNNVAVARSVNQEIVRLRRALKQSRAYATWSND